MNIIILDDYQDAVRKLQCATKLEPLNAKVFTNTVKGIGQLAVRLRDADILVLIRERTKAGLTAAAARGRKGGRKPVVTADKLQRARELVANGLNVREAAARLKVGKTALYAALQAASSGSAADS